MSEKKVEFRLVGEPLPDDVVAVGYDFVERLSTPYEALVTFSTRDANFKPASCLRGSLSLHVIDTDRGRERHVSGVCDRAEFVHHDGDNFLFRVRLVPQIAALSQREDCRIYQDKGPVDVVKELLAAAGVDKIEWRLRTEYPKREYIVQYRESELEFMHRLLEEEGIFYFFSHAGGESTMVLSDSTEAISEELAVPTVLSLSAGEAATDSISHVTLERKLVTTSVMLRDFDFERPQSFPQAAQPSEGAFPQPVYEYPGGFKEQADGQRRVSARLRELKRDETVVRGNSSATNLEVGKIVTITGAAQEPLNGTFVIVELVGRGSQSMTGQAETGGARAEQGAGGSQSTVENEFVAIPEGSPYAPPRRTKKPRIHGVQTAMITGPSMGEEEIHTDKYGRVKVRFRWDRVGQHDDKSSCWLRVMQAPLGGQLIIPRVGWEVAVGFFEGDPDRPYVCGRIYNAERTPPYALPATKTSGAIKSASSPGGAGANELKLGDSGGGQGFNLTAQKDLNVTVGHDQNESVAVDDAGTVKVNASQSVGSNQATTVGGNYEANVGSVASQKVSGSESISVGGNAVDNAISNYVEKVGGDRANSVGGNMLVICNGIEHTIAGDHDRTVGAIMLDGSVASVSAAVAGNVTESIGLVKIDLCKGPFSETVSGNKSSTFAAVDLHLVKGSRTCSSDAAITSLIGGLHLAKVTGDYTVKAPVITLLGAVGLMKAGGSELKMGGGPITLKASAVEIETALVIKMGTALKMGAG